MDLGQHYLETVAGNFENMKQTAEKAMVQLSFEQLSWTLNDESNSIVRIVKHLSGNMVSRWTDFLVADGEKPNRNRDEEFQGGVESREALLQSWEMGWGMLFNTIGQLTTVDLLKTVYIRRQPLTVLQAIERQVYHVSYHIGQIVYLAKQICDKNWSSLTIPKGKSNEFLMDMVKRYGQEHERS